MVRSRLGRLLAAALPALALLVPGAAASPVSASPAPTRHVALAAAAPTLATDTVAGGLDIPWDLDFLPTGRMVVTERPGRIRVYSSGSPGAGVVQTVTVPSVRAQGESGVMGLAVDVDFDENGYVFVCASREYSGSGGWVNEVLRYRVDPSGTSWSGPTVIRSGMVANTTHNGCALAMDATGRLWVGMGDAGTASRAQDRGSLNGKILRMGRSGGVPSDNPLIEGRRDVVYSMGHRNPQGIAFRPGSSQVYEVEHGPNVDDEVNLLAAGGNYGWPCYTGDGRPNATQGCAGPGSYRAPLWASGSSTIATSGASFARGAQWQDFEGHLFVPTLKQSDLRRFPVSADGTSVGAPATLFDTSFGRIRGSVSGPGGQLYLTTSNGSTNDRVVRVSPATPSVTRVGGSNRFATAAVVSAATHPSGATDVVVATGADFPDALAVGAVAGRLGMPVLLTGSGTLPSSTRTELARLRPQRVHVLGGTSAVSDSVLRALDAYASAGDADRVGGANRYETAARVSARWGRAGSPVIVASGQDFADALAAGPAGARATASVLLVGRDRVPAATAAELRRLAPSRVYVVGGTSAVGSATATSLGSIAAAPVTRVAGSTRYGTARALAARFWGTADAWVASGTQFPDGLTGGAAAGAKGSPLLLSGADAVPSSTGLALLGLAPRRATLVGGSGALGAPVLTTVRRLLGTP